jgi:hypothetical protein
MGGLEDRVDFEGNRWRSMFAFRCSTRSDSDRFGFAPVEWLGVES